MKNLKLFFYSLLIFSFLCPTSQAHNRVPNHALQSKSDDVKSEKKSGSYILGLGIIVCVGGTVGYYYADQRTKIQKLNNDIQSLTNENDELKDLNEALRNKNQELLQKNTHNQEVLLNDIQSLTNENDELKDLNKKLEKNIQSKQVQNIDLNNNTNQNQLHIFNSKLDKEPNYSFLYQPSSYKITNKIKNYVAMFTNDSLEHQQIEKILGQLNHLEIFLLTRQLYFSNFFINQISCTPYFFHTLNLKNNKKVEHQNIANKIFDKQLEKQHVYHCTSSYDVLLKIIHNGVIPSLGEQNNLGKRPGAFFALGKPASSYGNLVVEFKYEVLFISLPQTQVVDSNNIWVSSFYTIPFSEQTVNCIYLINDYNNNADKIRKVLKKNNLIITVEEKNSHDDIEVQNVTNYIVPKYIATSNVSQVSQFKNGFLIQDTGWQSNYNVSYIGGKNMRDSEDDDSKEDDSEDDNSSY